MRGLPRLRIRHPPRPLLIAAGALTLLGSAVWLGDRLLEGLYLGWRPRLERQVGRVMGHPFELGPYRGLGLAGLRVGPSRLLPGSRDGSSVRAEALVASIDPLTSLRRRALVLDLRLVGARAELRPNAAGQFWVLGQQAPGGEPPRLELRIGVQRSGELLIHRFASPQPPQRLRLSGQVAITTHERRLGGRLRLAIAGDRGYAGLGLTGDWQRRHWQFDLQPRGVSLQPLASYLPGRSRLAGRLSGGLRLDLDQGRQRCDGDLQVRRFRWQQPGAAAPLSADRLALSCRGDRLQLARSAWRFGGWRGRVDGRLGLDRSLALQLHADPPAAGSPASLPIEGRLQGLWRGARLERSRLALWSGASRLEASGLLGPSLALTGWWRLDPRDLPAARRLPDWLRQRPVGGRFSLAGAISSPRLGLRTSLQARDRLLGPWRADLDWRAGLLRLERFEAPWLRARAELPLTFRSGGGLVSGPLQAWIDLRDVPLAALNDLVGTGLRGRLDANGWLRGPLPALAPDLAVAVHAPGAGPLRLQESWSGRLQADGAAGARLDLRALPPGLPGTLELRLDRRWTPNRLQLWRQDGALVLEGAPRRSHWRARALPLHGLELLPGGTHPAEPIEGILSGEGRLGLTPLAIDGQVDLRDPGLFALAGRRLQASLHYAQRRYRLQGRVQPLSGGSIGLDLSGRWAGAFQARLQARELSSPVFRQMAQAWEHWRGRPMIAQGRAADLGRPAIETLGLALHDQLATLAVARERLQAWEEAQRARSRAERLRDLQLRVDADLLVQGPDLRRARIDMEARGHLWLEQADRDLALARDPFTVRLQGPLVAGEGQVAISGLTLALFSLLTPVPDSLRGFLAIQGRYRLGRGRPELALDLDLDQASLAGRGLRLERGRLELLPAGLRLDLALQAEGSSSTVDLSGLLPLNGDSQALELRLASRGDGLRFLTDLAGRGITWHKGSADLRLLVRGSLADPTANGFLRIHGGHYSVVGQSLRDVEASVLFDFQQLLLQNLQARVGNAGRISGEGRLGLVRPISAEPSLAVRLEAVPFALERIRARADGRLQLGGSLAAPLLGGSLAISRGTINARPGQLGRVESQAAAGAPAATGGSAAAPAPAGADRPATSGPTARSVLQPTSLNELLQRRWDFSQPLVLLGPDVESSTNLSLQEAIPQLPWLRFDDLRLGFGPDLAVVMPTIATFRTAGSLRISGRLDSSLRASGVVRLLSGRLNLFTTTFSLDPDAANVAVFTPSLGLVPYLDIALRTRIADNLNVIAPSGVGTLDLAPPSQGARDSQGFSSLSQLNLILVTVSVSGPADRLADSLRLRSSPPLPQERLVALIGGNSLAGLRGGQAGTALATALGQSLLSPLLGSLSDAMGQRVSLALYPAYVNPAIDNPSERSSGRIPPQLVLAGEVGFDLTNRLNASLLVAPNRSDIPPQMTLNYKASESVNVGASIDTQGAWQTVLQLFLRF